MVSALSIVFMVFTLLICFALPLGLVYYFYRKEGISLVAVLVGALVFVVSQMLLRIPLLQYLSGMPWYQQLAGNLLLIALLLSVTAGLFEEVGRFLGFKYLLRRHLSWKNGIAFGIGHGGIEAIILVGLTYINNIVYSLMINRGTFDQMIAPQLGPQMADYIKDQLINTSPDMFAAAGLERAFTIVIHIALSLVVLLAVTKGKPIFLLYAILLHTLINFPAVIIPGLGYSIWFAEIYVMLLALAGYIFIIRSKNSFPDTDKPDQ
ncbi:MAG: YhfC family intramembrane metalloprotease [Candidatus Syntrophonatronum acetioxidans]|uniref:YhfC family intramembrane metalloprotease n=1 Tax=Candidatus Syntrophonatronum acetioxidans TaxID=1795816 RepID=A0A424YCY8_9FIRM|nr:MAG: YhfC family intramembrane metalloprotease [Candidatus Syntrophonatronum acetioxidans]